MRILIVGDYVTGTGPSNVTKRYIECLGQSAVPIKSKSKLFRALEICLKTVVCDITVCSGYSAQNIVAAKCAHFLHKKCVYLMHGCVEHENAINMVPDENMNRVERETLRLSDRVYAVSNHFAKWLRANYPEYAAKTEVQANGIETDWLVNREKEASLISSADRRGILSIGGGMPRKKIKYIAKAVEKLREEDKYKELTLTVIGSKGLDTEEINSFGGVNNLGLVPYDRTKELLRNSRLFIQNSCFETFGLAPMEALMMGCDVLMSSKIGALELFDDVQSMDIISEYDNVEEIKEKIRWMLDNHNCDRLISSIDKESASWEKRTEQLRQKLMKLLQNCPAEKI